MMKSIHKKNLNYIKTKDIVSNKTYQVLKTTDDHKILKGEHLLWHANNLARENRGKDGRTG